jgi:hypothetical protein
MCCTYQIEVDPRALEKYQLTIADVAQAVEMNNRNSGGALVSNGQQAMVVRGVGLIQSVPDIRHVALKAKDGVPVRRAITCGTLLSARSMGTDSHDVPAFCMDNSRPPVWRTACRARLWRNPWRVNCLASDDGL